jgi:hypothetical protein
MRRYDVTSFFFFFKRMKKIFISLHRSLCNIMKNEIFINPHLHMCHALTYAISIIYSYVFKARNVIFRAEETTGAAIRARLFSHSASGRPELGGREEKERRLFENRALRIYQDTSKLLKALKFIARTDVSRKNRGCSSS